MALAQPSCRSQDTAGFLSAIAVAAGVALASSQLLDGTTFQIILE